MWAQGSQYPFLLCFSSFPSHPLNPMPIFRMNHKPLALSLFSPVQSEVCAGVLADVIRCVLSGSDGCVLGLGCADVGE